VDRWLAGASCRTTTAMTIAATAAEAASGMSPVIHRRGGVFCSGVSSFGAGSGGPWLWRHWCQPRGVGDRCPSAALLSCEVGLNTSSGVGQG